MKALFLKTNSQGFSLTHENIKKLDKLKTVNITNKNEYILNLNKGDYFIDGLNAYKITDRILDKDFIFICQLFSYKNEAKK